MMDRSALEAELKRLKETLEDLEEVLAFNFANTSAHIPGRLVAKDEEAIELLKREIAEIGKLLDGRETD